MYNASNSTVQPTAAYESSTSLQAFADILLLCLLALAAPQRRHVKASRIPGNERFATWSDLFHFQCHVSLRHAFYSFSSFRLLPVLEILTKKTPDPEKPQPTLVIRDIRTLFELKDRSPPLRTLHASILQWTQGGSAMLDCSSLLAGCS
jgi:hypothetical protein